MRADKIASLDLVTTHLSPEIIPEAAIIPNPHKQHRLTMWDLEAGAAVEPLFKPDPALEKYYNSKPTPFKDPKAAIPNVVAINLPGVVDPTEEVFRVIELLKMDLSANLKSLIWDYIERLLKDRKNVKS